MKMSEFFDHLWRTRGWKCDQGGAIHRDRRNGTVECPITAVANKIAGRDTFADPNCWREAAEYLRLHKLFAAMIVTAADWDESIYPANRRYRRYRKRLLQACRIKERKDC